jgi:dTDP-4-dehydrorhamnose reductase
MNILLTGAAGQLGSELLPMLSARGRVTATDRSTPASITASWTELDISNGARLEVLLNNLRPALIVNTAAYTAVDQAEENPETAFAVNAELPGRLARWAKLNDARLIHYSTDYVFNGEADRPYLETDKPDPQSVYGDSKLAGESAIEVTGCQHVILRTSWVYSSHGKNFVLSMLDLARRGLSLKVVDDQLGCPTWARNLAQASNAVIERWQTPGVDCPSGVYHYCDDRSLNWYEFASDIFSLAVSAGLLESHPELTPVPGSEFPQPAKRPKWSVLNTSRINQVFNIHPASFNQSLQTVIDEVSTRSPRNVRSNPTGP